jgi:hypothetical protein
VYVDWHNRGVLHPAFILSIPEGRTHNPLYSVQFAEDGIEDKVSENSIFPDPFSTANEGDERAALARIEKRAFERALPDADAKVNSMSDFAEGQRVFAKRVTPSMLMMGEPIQYHPARIEALSEDQQTCTLQWFSDGDTTEDVRYSVLEHVSRSKRRSSCSIASRCHY